MSLDLQQASRVSRAVAMQTPLEFVAGEGAELIATDGQRYLDCVAGFGVNNTGHCHPRVTAAIAEQAGRLMHTSTLGGNAVTRAYAERLCDVVPIREAKVFFTNSGTESVEAALKLARYATGRPGVVSFSGGFHGRTLGSLSVSTSKAAFRAGHEPLLAGAYVAPYPQHDLDAALAALDEMFERQVVPERVAAVLVEPILGEGGYVVPPDGFLPALRERCDRHGMLLVVDEVQSGFGRTGRLFAHEWVGVEADLMTLAKGIGSGFPMGALVGRGELLDAWAPGAHGNTFGGNPLACAAASATLDVLQDDGLVANARDRGSELRDGIRALEREHAATIVDVRGRGLMVGVETASPQHAEELRLGLLQRRVIVSVCGVDYRTLRLSPPLVLAPGDVTRVVDALAATLAA